jgi:hypothetical protein
MGGATEPLVPVRRTMVETLLRINDFDGPTRAECWKAVSKDGVWVFERTDDAHTLWEVIHEPTKTVLPCLFGSLRSARATIASGLYDDECIRLLALADKERFAHLSNPLADRNVRSAQQAADDYVLARYRKLAQEGTP